MRQSLIKVSALIDEATFLPTVCINIVIGYYDIRPVVKQMTENYLPQILDTELINDLNMDRVIDRAVPVFERAIQVISQADMKSEPWLCNDEDDCDEIISLIIGHGGHTSQFMDLYPTMRHFLSFTQDNISGSLYFRDNTVSDKFFRELILFAGGKEFTRIPIVVVDL
jgi:hypothetical protein